MVSGYLLFKLTVSGEPCSKANSRKAVTNARTGRMMFIKSKNAREYESSFLEQIKLWRGMSKSYKDQCAITEDVIFEADIYYGTRRKDLDESLILDCLQKSGVYKNDRQVKKKIVTHHIDKDFPRAEIKLYKMGEEL